ncbi:MAG: aminotransferase class IV [Proteiniphilum sp.]|nr:aminotransferase class IV [Proteiniphilum sp.]
MFLETICILNGKVQNEHAHVERMQQTAAYHRITAPPLPGLEKMLPVELTEGRVKCRIIYNNTIEEVAFAPYHPKVIASLRLVEASPDYTFKYADRSALLNLLKQKGDYDEILITRNGLITDTSYSNVVLSKGDHYYTPHTFLLNGTKRQQLLLSGRIREREIRVASLGDYDRIYLINAMLDIEDGVSLPISSIYP